MSDGFKKPTAWGALTERGKRSALPFTIGSALDGSRQLQLTVKYCSVTGLISTEFGDVIPSR